MLKENNHTIIMIPGLGDNTEKAQKRFSFLIKNWNTQNFHPVIFSPLWRTEEKYNDKLLRLLELIDSNIPSGLVSLVGTSAGASLAFNGFLKRKETVHRAVNICGRLRKGNDYFRSLDKMAATSNAFKNSVLEFEKNEPQLSTADRQRLMTIRPLFGDELVPRDTACLDGANNKWVYTPEHMISIAVSLLFPQAILEFLSMD